MEHLRKFALQPFVENHICGNTNLWDQMSKIKFLNWEDACRTVKLKSKPGHFKLKVTNSLFARLLIIAKSSHQFDLEEVMPSI